MAPGRLGQVSVIRFVTFNIHWGVGRGGRYDLSATADLLASLDADVIALQEVDRHYDERSGFDDQPAVLGQRLGLHQAYAASVVRPLRARPDGEYGLALLARAPLDDVQHRLLVNRDDCEQRSLLATRVAGVSVVTTHLEYSSPALRLDQAREVSDFVDDLPGPVVVLGDLNDEPGSPPLQALIGGRAPLADALDDLPALRDRPTFEDRAKGRIDHVLHDPGLAVSSAEIVDTLVSDHAAVVVDLRL